VAVQQGGVTWVSIAAGNDHTCGLTSGGAAYCWGLNGDGQLGDNTTTQRLTPVAVQQGGVTFASITGGADHTCGLTSGGAAYCWGDNSNGRLGDNTMTQRLTPAAVGGWSQLGDGSDLGGSRPHLRRQIIVPARLLLGGLGQRQQPAGRPDHHRPVLPGSGLVSRDRR